MATNTTPPSTTLTSPGVDGLTIDLRADWEVAYWTRKLDVSEDELRRAGQAAGNRLSELVGFLLSEKSNANAQTP